MRKYVRFAPILRLALREKSWYNTKKGKKGAMMKTKKRVKYTLGTRVASDGTEYELVLTERKTLAVEVRAEKTVVRAPTRLSESLIDAFVVKNAAWIRRKRAENVERSRAAEEFGTLGREELAALADKARAYLPPRVAYYASLLGASYKKITVRCQKTKWGSCSAGGNLNFNLLLMLTPPEVIDSVVAHEVCHLKEMNHSKRFYDELFRIFPNYGACRKWLKENGGAIMSRVGRT